MEEYSKYLYFARDVAKAAGELLMKGHGKSHKADYHIRTNFKIAKDKECDDYIRSRIIKKFPSHNILSEEKDMRDMESGFNWVIDPLDGTIPYSRGMSDHFAVCIALCLGEEPVVGVVYAPKRDELYTAEKGQGAYCNSERIEVSNEDNINRVHMNADCGKEQVSHNRASLFPYLAKLYSPDGITCLFTSGCASVPLCLTAKGNLDAYFAFGLEPWDMAAAVIINTEAGAKVTNKNGIEWKLGDDSILAANPALHEKLFYFMELGSK